MVGALVAALESPQVPPEGRERIVEFLKLHRGAAASLDTTRPDLFVRDITVFVRAGWQLVLTWGLLVGFGTPAAILLPNRLVMLIGTAWVATGAPVVRDHEHDAHAWWPADPAAWPDEADPVLRRMATMLVAA